MRRDGDDDLLRAGDQLGDGGVVLLGEDGVAVANHDERWDAQLAQPLVAVPARHRAVVHAPHGARLGEDGDAQPLFQRLDHWAGQAHELARAGREDEARGRADQHEARDLVGMAQRILGGDGPAEGVRDEQERALRLQLRERRLQVVHQRLHGDRRARGIVALAVAAQVRGDHAHRLAEGAELVEPLQVAPAVAVDEDERARGLSGATSGWMSMTLTRRSALSPSGEGR